MRYCSFEVFLHFVYKRCNIQITNEYNNTILHKAAYYNRPKIIKHVARRRLIDINAQDDLGYTALHHAAYNNNDECCRVLLEFNIDKNITHRSGHTAYDVAIKNGRHQCAEIIKHHNSRKSEEFGLIEIEDEELSLEEEIIKDKTKVKAQKIAKKMKTHENYLKKLQKIKEKEIQLNTKLLIANNIISEEKQNIESIKEELNDIQNREQQYKNLYREIDEEISDVEEMLEELHSKDAQKCQMCTNELLSGVFQCVNNHKICQNCKEGRLLQACPFCEAYKKNDSIRDKALSYLMMKL